MREPRIIHPGTTNGVNKTGEKRTGAVPGHEFSGVVAQLGDGAGSANVGDEVFGMNDWFADGATAEYCVAPESAVAPKPRCLSHSEGRGTFSSSRGEW